MKNDHEEYSDVTTELVSLLCPSQGFSVCVCVCILLQKRIFFVCALFKIYFECLRILHVKLFQPFLVISLILGTRF